MGFADNWENFLGNFRGGLKQLAENAFGGFLDAAKNDAEAFLTEMREALQRWTKALTDGQLNKAEFESLLKGQKSLAKLHALTAVGLSQQRLERFRSGLISLVTTSIYSAFSL